MAQCKHKQLLDMDNQPVFCEECGGKICDKCGRCFDCDEAYITRPTARQLAAEKRFRCKCGIFVKMPSGVPPGENRTVLCARGHSVTYHSPAVYYVRGFRDPITGIIGDNSNSGLSGTEPLCTISEAIRRCISDDTIIVANPEF